MARLATKMLSRIAEVASWLIEKTICGYQQTNVIELHPQAFKENWTSFSLLPSLQISTDKPAQATGEEYQGKYGVIGRSYGNRDVNSDGGSERESFIPDSPSRDLFLLRFFNENSEPSSVKISVAR